MGRLELNASLSQKFQQIFVVPVWGSCKQTVRLALILDQASTRDTGSRCAAKGANWYNFIAENAGIAAEQASELLSKFRAGHPHRIVTYALN